MVRFCDGLGDRKAETGPADLVSPVRLEARKPIEDMLELFGRDP